MKDLNFTLGTKVRFCFLHRCNSDDGTSSIFFVVIVLPLCIGSQASLTRVCFIKQRCDSVPTAMNCQTNENEDRKIETYVHIKRVHIKPTFFFYKFKNTYKNNSKTKRFNIFYDRRFFLSLWLER